MKNWTLTIKIGENEEDNLNLFDVKGFLNGYLSINRNFFDEILNIVKMIKKYTVGKGIERVIGPNKKDWTQNSWVLLMFKDNEKQVPFWLLIKREKDLTGTLVAIGPEDLYQYYKDSKEPDDEIKRIIEYIVSYPQKFKLSMIIPNFIS